MTAYSFRPNANSTFVDWHDPSVWAGGVVPNAPDADVDFPTVTQTSTGSAYTSFVNVLAGESFAVRSVDLRDYLILYGSLTVSGQLTQETDGEIDMMGGTLTAGSIVNNAYDIQGDGHLVVGTLTNNALVIGGNLTIDATTLVNNGTLEASQGTMTINVGAGGLSGFSGGTLASGTLAVLPRGTLALNVGSLITTDAATISLDGGIITSRDPATGQDVPLATSLHTITAAGTLTLNDVTEHFGQLTVAGKVALANGAQFGADQLVIAAGGHVAGSGTIANDLENDGLVQVGTPSRSDPLQGYGTLVVNGAATGTGSFEILRGSYPSQYGTILSATLELGSAASNNVRFDNGYGTLVLDRPAGFTGAITTTGYSDQIILGGVSLASVTGTSYTGDASGGTLTLQEGSSALTFRFTGAHTASDFALSAGPQALSTDPPSLRLTVNDPSAPADIVLTSFSPPGTVQLSGAASQLGFGFVIPVNGSEHPTDAYVTLDRPLDVQGQSGNFLTDHPYIYYTGTGGTDTPTAYGLTQYAETGYSSYTSYSDGLAIAADTRAGTYNILGLTFVDGTGHARTYSAGELAAMGDATSFTISDALAPMLSGLSLPRFVAAHGASPVTFGVSASDLNSAVASVVLTLDRPLATANGAVTSLTFAGGSTTLDETLAGAQAGAYHVTAATVTDTAGNVATYTSHQLAALGSPSGFVIGASAADFNGDGHSDILWQNVNGAASTWHATDTGASDGIVQDTYDAHVDTNWTALDSFDFNGDGRADILWQNKDGTVAVWDGTATGFSQSSFVGSLGLSYGTIAGTGDFNGDGLADLLYRNADGSFGVDASTGTALQTGTALGYAHGSVGANWLIEGAADFTGDGKADILFRNTDGSLSTWDANGVAGQAASFQEDSWYHGPIDRSWHVVGLGDFNGDGRADILWRNDNGAVSVWTSTGDHGFVENQFNASAASNWSVAEVGDFNGDGKADILWRNTAGQISIWHSTGTDWAQNTYFDGSVGNDWHIATHEFVL